MISYPNTLSERADNLHKKSGIEEDYLINLLNDPCVKELLECLEAEEVSFKDLLPESNDKVRLLFEKLFTDYLNIVTAFSRWNKVDEKLFPSFLREMFFGNEEDRTQMLAHFIENRVRNQSVFVMIQEMKKNLNSLLTDLDSFLTLGKSQQEVVLLTHLAASPLFYGSEEGEELVEILIEAINRARREVYHGDTCWASQLKHSFERVFFWPSSEILFPLNNKIANLEVKREWEVLLFRSI